MHPVLCGLFAVYLGAIIRWCARALNGNRHAPLRYAQTAPEVLSAPWSTAECMRRVIFTSRQPTSGYIDKQLVSIPLKGQHTPQLWPGRGLCAAQLGGTLFSRQHMSTVFDLIWIRVVFDLGDLLCAPPTCTQHHDVNVFCGGADT